jgi:hypothetical protein
MPAKKKQPTTKAKKKVEEVKHCTCGADEEPLVELNGSKLEEITLIVQWDHYYAKAPYPYSLEDAIVGALKNVSKHDRLHCPDTGEYMGEFSILKSGSTTLSLRKTEPCNRALVKEGDDA